MKSTLLTGATLSAMLCTCIAQSQPSSAQAPWTLRGPLPPGESVIQTDHPDITVQAVRDYYTKP